ncbi:MAG: hypothetical protein CVT77_09515 [Alphaproteobacteria bacterium HGW-Alphaproteobacteria-16]|nr:MAG: hypothetical protein CVT77_09515 [Alphaproteobacteria bacterium HGW-Alphaproteobacteria-16]
MNVNATGPNLNIRIQQESRFSESSTIREVSTVIESVAEAIRNGVPGPITSTERVVFDVRFGKADTPDRFGLITFSLKDFKSYEKSGSSILNRVSGWDMGSGRSAEDAVRSCQEESTFVLGAETFCEIILRDF